VLAGAFSKDQLLTNVMLYWVTGTIASAFLPYYEVAHVGAMGLVGQKLKQWIGSASVPAAFAMFPKDLSHPPREWAVPQQISASVRGCQAFEAVGHSPIAQVHPLGRTCPPNHHHRGTSTTAEPVSQTRPRLLT